MIYGYARVSTQEQQLDSQLDDLQRIGCQKIFQEKVSGAKSDRPELKKLLQVLKKGDSVVVWKLDRLGRSVKDLINITNSWKENGVVFISIKDAIDTSTPTGRFFFNIMASLTELEREMIRERTTAGLKAAKARGRLGGRPAGLSDEAKVKALGVKRMYDGGASLIEIMNKYKITKPTIYKYIRTII